MGTAAHTGRASRARLPSKARAAFLSQGKDSSYYRCQRDPARLKERDGSRARGDEGAALSLCPWSPDRVVPVWSTCTSYTSRDFITTNPPAPRAGPHSQDLVTATELKWVRGVLSRDAAPVWEAKWSSWLCPRQGPGKGC